MGNIYNKTFDIRWSDLDANRHLLNSSYLNYMSHTRMSYLALQGITQSFLHRIQIGPVALHEHMYYFKELHPEDRVTCSLELHGLSDQGMFFAFHHRFYNKEKMNCALGTVLGAWISLKSRTLINPPTEIYEALIALHHTSDFKRLTKEDTREPGIAPISWPE